MTFRARQPGCACCEELDCELVESDFESDTSSDWEQIAGESTDWSIAAGKLTMATGVELLHTTSHPSSPHGMRIDARFRATEGTAILLFLAMNSAGTTGIIVELRTGPHCGRLRAVLRAGGDETLFSQYHAVAPMEADTWYEFSACWDAEEQRLTIILPDGGTGEPSTLRLVTPGVVEYPPVAVDGPRWGLGAEGAGSVEVDTVDLTAIGEFGGTQCPVCNHSCTLLVDGANADTGTAVRCTFDVISGTWVREQYDDDPVAGWGYSIEGAGTLTHRTDFYSSAYTVGATIYGLLSGNKVRVYYNAVNYIDVWIVEVATDSYTLRLQMNGGTIVSAAGVTETLKQVLVSLCVSRGTTPALHATVRASNGHSWFSGWTRHSTATFINNDAPHKISLESITASTDRPNRFGGLTVSRASHEDPGCAGCVTRCTGCSEVELPGTLLIDVPSWASGPCGFCSMYAGQLALGYGSWGGQGCFWGVSRAECPSGCENNPARDGVCLPTSEFAVWTAVAGVASFMGGFRFTAKLEIRTRFVVSDPGQPAPCLNCYETRHEAWYAADWTKDWFGNQACIAKLPITLSKTDETRTNDTADPQRTPICDGVFPNTVTILGWAT